ncbi:MAG: GGDEF domain-containing protein [Aphanocapsa sp. GSE-SYN-MK-11-07L]|jgi:diguanylate cyclase (GGDEF)-like protein|nr:GGDEF domain-containing protein [Aphanocapsa sp. GSE-SYN-MK-11-07L]
MGTTLDFTNIDWEHEFAISAPIEGVVGTMTGQGQLADGDKIIFCLQCHVNEVEYYSNASDIWRAEISLQGPVSINSIPGKNRLESVKNIIAKLGDALHEIDVYLQVEKLFTRDRLTQVANRGRFESLLLQEWKRMQREQKPISLVLCAFDGWNDYKSAHEQPSRDEFLIEVSQLIRSCGSRSTDLTARIQENVFAIMLPQTPSEGAMKILEKVRFRVSDLQPFVGEDQSNLRLRLETVTMMPSSGTSPQALVLRAENFSLEA